MPSDTPPATPVRWEYTSLKFATESGFLSATDFDNDDLTNRLNQLGSKGWELVSIFTINRHEGGSKFVNAVLKRPR